MGLKLFQDLDLLFKLVGAFTSKLFQDDVSIRLFVFSIENTDLIRFDFNMFNIDPIFEMVYLALVQFDIVFQNVFTHLS